MEEEWWCQLQPRGFAYLRAAAGNVMASIHQYSPWLLSSSEVEIFHEHQKLELIWRQGVQT